MTATFGIRVKKSHTYNGVFSEEGFKSDVSDNNQTISYCGVGAHFQNGLAKAAIKQLTEKVRTILIHVKYQWPEVIQPCLWPFMLKQAEFTWITSVSVNLENLTRNILVLCTTKSTSGIIKCSVARWTYSMHDFNVPVLFWNGPSKWEWAHTLEDPQFTRETFPSY